MMGNDYEYDLMATKRNDPSYEQVSGYIHKDLALKFRIICTTERLTQSDALEEALKFWTEFRKNEGNNSALSEVSASAEPAPTPTETTPPPARKAKRGKRNKEVS
jgi:hypothetical protein